MSKYDSVLDDSKEKQPVKEPITIHLDKYLIIYVISLVILLIGSYLVYYFYILSPSNIFLNDVNDLEKELLSLMEPLKINEFGDVYTLDGTLDLNDKTYTYSFIRDNKNIKLEFSNQDSKLDYYINDYTKYISLSSFKDEYIKLTDASNLNILYNIKNNYSEYISDDDYYKSIYLEDNRPVVEVTLSLSSDIVAKITGSTLKDKYNIILTFKNDAFFNEIISIKAIVNNETDNTRETFTYSDDTLTYVDSSGSVIKYVLSKDGADFTLKIYHDDNIYSVITGTTKEESYEYSYQVIDQVYNLTLVVSESEGSYNYDFTSKIEYVGETKTNTAKLSINYSDMGALDEDVSSAILYSSLSDEEKTTYENNLSSLIGALREFVDEY